MVASKKKVIYWSDIKLVTKTIAVIYISISSVIGWNEITKTIYADENKIVFRKIINCGMQ